jgi:predicted porin
MKKNLIAAAVAAAVAAPAAFAADSVSISGMVNPEFSNSDAVTTGTSGSVNTDLVFKASTDLGNGMKASMKYHLYHDDGAYTGVADESVALSGGFGTLVAGRFETFNMAYFHPKADMDPSHDITLEDSLGQQSRANGSLAYVTPSMGGFTAGIATLSSAGMADSGTDTSDVDGQEFMVKYANAGLELAAGQTQHDGVAADEKVTNVYAGYKMGDMKVGILYRDVENDNGSTAATADNKSTTANVAYTMGANTLSLGYLNSDDARDGDYVVALKHSMSKNVNAYVAYKGDDDSDNTTLVGIKYAF